tara:strand:- start:683 stop:997 length:315 start_codon:yes stop_codon:yes gene_type:complete
MTGKGDKNRTTDRKAYDNNWNNIFGSKQVMTPAKQEMMERANHQFPGTLGALKDDAKPSPTHTQEEMGRKMREWDIMYQYLIRIQYCDYPVEEAKEILKQIKIS